MSKLELFSPPNGETIINPDRKMLESLILSKGDGYWNAGAGQGCLKFYSDNNQQSQLLITISPPHGYYLEFVDHYRSYYVSIGSNDYTNTTEVYIGGDPLVLPVAFLISKELTWQAVIDFCNTGERSTKVEWKARAETGWSYGMQD